MKTTNHSKVSIFILVMLLSMPMIYGLTIGGRIGSFFNGTIDEVRIYNKSLSAAEISQLQFASIYKLTNNQWGLISNQSSLAEATYTYQASICDLAGLCNSTETRTIILDSSVPLIEYAGGTEQDNTFVNRTWVYINVTAYDDTEANITFYLYNSTGSLNITTFETGNRSFNFTNLNTNQIYFYNVTIIDYLNLRASTDTRKITLDSIEPSITLNLPNNDAYINSSFVDFNWTSTDNMDANITCNITVDGTVNQSEVATTNDTAANYTITGFNDDIYLWNVTCWDGAFNINISSETRTFTIDPTFPSISFAGGTEDNNTYFNRDWVFVNVSLTETNMNVTRFYLYNTSGLVNNTNYTDSTTFINFTSLNSDMIYYYNVTHMDDANNTNSTATRIIILDTIPPLINKIECSNDSISSWMDCTSLLYGHNLTHVRANCTDTNEINLTYTLKNIPDNNVTINSSNYNYTTADWFTYNTSGHVFADSGVWNLTVTCNDVSTLSSTNSSNWTIAWGTLQPYLIAPTNISFNTGRNLLFNFTSGVNCVGGECVNISAILDP